jgi:hypothetical protein
MRRVRELRTQFGCSITTKNTRWPELKSGEYILADPEPISEHDRKIKTRSAARFLSGMGINAQNQPVPGILRIESRETRNSMSSLII